MTSRVNRNIDGHGDGSGGLSGRDGIGWDTDGEVVVLARGTGIDVRDGTVAGFCGGVGVFVVDSG